MKVHKEHPWLTAGTLVFIAMLWGFFIANFKNLY